MDSAEELPATHGERCRVEDLHLAPVVDKEVAKEHAPWRNLEMRAHWDATHALLLGGVDAACSARSEDHCDRARGQGERLQGKGCKGLCDPRRSEDHCDPRR